MNVDTDVPKNLIHGKSAIHLMVKDVPTAFPTDTVQTIKQKILQQAKSYNSIDYVYIINEHTQLVGVIGLKDLLILPAETILKQVMTQHLVFVKPHTHREKVGQLALKHNIKAIPVLEKDNTLLGVIPSDVILRVAHDELTEDILLLEGIHSKEYSSISPLNNSPFKLSWRRIPWLLMGLVGGLLAAYIIGFFEELLAEEVILISFLPLMVYMSDAVGSQSQTIFIRSYALNSKVNIAEYLYKEIIVGIFIAISLSVILFFFVGLSEHLYLGFILGSSLFFTILISVLVAVLIPWFLTKLKKDPAIGSGPFATILRDILSIIIYFSVSHVLLAL